MKEGGEPVRLTVKMLERAKIDLSAIRWKVHVENHKVFRRTDDTKDIVQAKVEFSDHRRHKLLGKCDNFGSKEDSVDLGLVQFIKPGARGTIRLRFTPAGGKIYGRSGTPIYRNGDWKGFDQGKPGQQKPGSAGKTWPHETLPPSLFANKAAVPPWLNGNRAESLGYFDDVCDGFISVFLKLRNGSELMAKARICVGPPSFIPDCLFIRTLADDLDQVVNGPTAEDIGVAEARERALDIVRRGFEAVRFMNVAVMNGNPVDGRAPEEFDTMPAEESFSTERLVRPVMSPASMDTAAIMALHRQVYAALSAGAAPWFPGLLRKPDEVGDLTDRGRRKMPALMSGADSFYLALTHRQIATVEKAAEAAVKSDASQQILPRNLTAERLLKQQLNHRADGNPLNSRPEMAIANCCPGLEVDFRAVWRHLFEGIELCEYDNFVVADTRKEADREPELSDLKGHRLLSIRYWDHGGNGILGLLQPRWVIVELKGPSPSDPHEIVPVLSKNNPHGVWTMEWSNCFAHVVNAQRKHKARLQLADVPVTNFEVLCDFTAEPAKMPQPRDTPSSRVKLRVRDFFEGETAVISEDLAKAGELTQGLCSPWQNDLRECSCFYWASSRPDFVNMTVGNDGLSHGDNWLAIERTGEYVPDDYADDRLMGYGYLFDNWEKALQFQIGGKDSASNLAGPDAATGPRKP
jgi:hypothetical protein